MPEIVATGQPFQSSDDVANSIYATTPPSFGREFGSLFGEGPTPGLQRSFERSQQGSTGYTDEALLSIFTADAREAGVPQPAPVQTPQLTAAEANNWYAPPGTKITDKPISQGLAQVIGKQKHDEMERENVIALAQAVHSWPRNFAVGLTAFTLDPINAATLFIPGVGDEAVSAALGRGFFARTAGRAVSGATGAAIGQVPLTALRYGMSQEEAGDYGARDALNDVFFAAAGGAVLQAGFGGLGELIRAKRGETRIQSPEAPATEPRFVPPSSESNAAAMRSGISQILDGRMVDVLPVIDADAIRLASHEADLRGQSDAISAQLTAIPRNEAEVVATEKLARLEAVESRLKAEDVTPEEHRTLQTRRDEILASTTPEKLRMEAFPAEIRRNLENQKTQVDAQIQNAVAQRTQAALDQMGPVGSRLAALGDMQRQLYRNGFAQGVPQAEFNAVNETVYGPKPEAPTETPQTRLAAAEKVAKPPAPKGGAKPTAEPKPTTPEEKEAADLEAQWKRVSEAGAIKLTPEQIAEIQGAVDDYNKTHKISLGYDQAGVCLNEAGV